MFSFTVPNFTEFTRFEPGADGRNPLSQQQAEPAAAFAELLELDLEALPAPAGQSLPLAGNGLPVALPAAVGGAGTGLTGPAPGPAVAAPQAAVPAVLPGQVLQAPAATGPVQAVPARAAMPQAAPVALPAADTAGGAQAMPVAGDGESAPQVARDPRHVPVLPTPPGSARESAPRAPGPGARSAPPTEPGRAAVAAGRELPPPVRPAMGPAKPIAARPPDGELPARAVTPATPAAPRPALRPETPAAAGVREAAGRATATILQPAPATDLEGPAALAATGASAAPGASPRPAAEALLQPTAPRAAPIEVPVGEPGWAEAVGQRVRLVSGSGIQTAEIRLSPAELGPLRIQIAVDDGAASVSFIAQHAVTREAIEQALPRLREMLADSGLTLAETSVGGEGVQQGQRDAGRAAAADGYGAPEAPAEADPGPGVAAHRREPAGLVDTFA